MLLIQEIENCKKCMSINHSMQCDSIDTRYSNCYLNFPCRYYIDRDEFIKDISNGSSFYVCKNKNT